MESVIMQRPYKRRASPDTTVSFMGGLLTFLVDGSDSAGRYALVEYRARKGGEPPPHIHANEDEIFYVVEGHLRVFVGSESFSVGPGEFVFLPRRMAHAFRIESPTAHLLAVIEPAGLEGFFRALGEPATSLELPAEAAISSPLDPNRFGELARKFGLSFPSGAALREQLPSFVGQSPRMIP
jgi:quercetin dioxygenase-like cupin family protein